jgi:pyruvate,water dikinase
MATHSAIDRLRTDCGDDDLAFGLLADLPALEASRPSLAMLRIAADARQTGAFDGPAIENFLLQYGHRGLNELDPTAPVWETQRSQLEAMIWRMAADHFENPVDTGRAVRTAALRRLRSLPAVRRQRVAADAAFARRLSVLGEQSKSDVARHVNQLRRVLTVLRERLHPQVDPDLTAMLSWRELRRATLGLGPVPVTLDARREALRFATSPIGAARGTVSKRSVLNGVAASPGTAAGTAVVVHDPTADTDTGDILVAHATDTAWTPLFLGKAAIVTDTGGVLSHTSIVARDLRIPAVVGTGNATTVIHTGDETHVDGDAGRVEIIR